MSAFPVEEGKVGSDFCETRQHVKGTEKSREYVQVHHVGNCRQDAPWFCKIRNTSIPDTSLEIMEDRKYDGVRTQVCPLKHN